MSLEETVTATPVIVKAASAISYVSTGSAFAFGMSAAWGGVLASFIVGILTFGVGRWLDYHFRQKHYLLEQAKHEFIIKQWKTTGVVDRRENGVSTRRDEICKDCPHVKGILS